MAINVSNTSLSDSFNTWRLNTNLVSTIVSNNVVTVSRAGSANRNGTSHGNGHIKGTFTANELRTTTLKGGNTSVDGVISISSNTTVNATTLNISANTIFTGNVNFTTAGTDRVVMGDISRIHVTGGTQGQFLRVATNTNTLDFKSLTLRDISDLSSNSANIILSGSNTTFSDNGDSPALVFATDSGDRVEMYIAKDATGGDSDLHMKLVDTNGDSKFTITDSANSVVCTIDSNGQANFSSDVTVVGLTSTGHITPTTDDTYDLGSATKEFRNLYIDGVANVDELSLGTASGQGVSTSMIPKTDGAGSLGSATRRWTDVRSKGTVYANNATVSGTLTTNGNVTLGDASTDTITVKGNVANVYVSGLGRIKELLVDENIVVSGNATFGAISLSDTTQSSNTSTGAIKVLGGVGILKNLNVGGSIHATGNITSDGDITLGNETSDTITMKGNFANQHTEGTATFGGTVGVGIIATTGYELETLNSTKIGQNLNVGGNTSITGNLTVSGNFSVPANSAFTVADANFTNLRISGNTFIGDATSDEVQINGTLISSIVPKTGDRQSLGSASSKWHQIYANNITIATNAVVSGNASITNNLTVTNDLDINGDADIAGAISNDGTVVIGANAKLHANNTISNDTITNAMLTNPSFTIRDGAAGTTDAVNLGETLQITEGEGIDVSISNNEITIAGEDSTTSNKGISKYDANNFTVSSGEVFIKSNSILTAQIANTMGSSASMGSSAQVPIISVNKQGQVIGISTANNAGVNGFNYTAANNTFKLTSVDNTARYANIGYSTTTTKGVSSFDSGDFDVSSGAVSLKDATTGAVIAISATTNETTVSRTNGTVAIGLPDDVTVTGQLNVGENLVVSGNLIVSGTTTTINTETINLADNIINLNSNHTGAPTSNAGISIERGSSTDKTLLWDEINDKWTVGSDTMVAGTFEGNLTGNLTGDVTGNTSGSSGSTTGNAATVTNGVYTSGNQTIGGTKTFSSTISGSINGSSASCTGNAATATKLAATKTIGMTGDVVWTSAGFDGSGNVTGTSTIQNNSVDLTTHTTGNYCATITGGTGLTSTGATSGEGIAHSLSVDADQRSNITQIGPDTNDYYIVAANNHSWYLDTTLDMTLRENGDLHCDGDVIAFSTTTASDIKLKENITPVENALDKVKQLTGVEFDWKKDGSRSAGVIAQDVEKVLPQAVKTVTGLNTDEEHKVVNYDSLHALLIEAVKELSAEIEILKGNK